jgi:Ser/Thr protein kinase RdoA (MazF antagonist)
MEQNVLNMINNTYPVRIYKVEPVTNEMYRCFGSHDVYFARVTSYKTYEEQVEEVNWTNFLYGKGIGVSPAITSVNGDSVEKVFVPQEKLAVLYEAAPGIHLPRSKWNATVLKELGRQIGKMHRLTKPYEKDQPVNNIKNWHEQEEFDLLKYIPEEEMLIRKIAKDVLSEMNKLPKDDSTYGLIHGDLWLENVLVDRDTSITMIDFQDCEKNFYLFDIATPIYSALEYSFAGAGNILDYGKAIKDALIEGYEEENNIPSEMLQHLPLVLKLKELFNYSLMHMYLDQDKLTEDQVRIMNLYRLRLEHNYPVLKL